MCLRFLRTRVALAIFLLLGLAAGGTRARAGAALLMEQPYGQFGSVNPTGHAAIYLDRICAETPTRLRMCSPDEDGVVISRYHRVGGYDWIAIPVLPYLYAVEHAEDIPATATATLESQLRDDYRRNHLLAIAPNTTPAEAAGEPPSGNWTQLVGAAYDRTIYGFEIETSPQQDERLVALLNDRRNTASFNLLYRNCADFSRNVLNLYYPHSVRRNFLVDFGITTPKQLARSLTKYARHHRALEFSVFVIPQVPGTIPRSHPVYGVMESMVKSKKYIVPLAVLSPHLTAGMVVAYFTDGRFKVPKNAEHVLVPDQLDDKPPTTVPAAE